MPIRRFLLHFAFALGLLAQSKPAPQFDVASIKPANPSARPGRMGGAIETWPGFLSTRSASLKELIAAAYAVEPYQVSGSAAWLDSARFAVEAKCAGPAAREQLLLMLEPLLADRFKLTFHRETRQVRVYALVLAKNGPKFHKWNPAAESAPGKVNRLGRNVDLLWFARYLTHFGADKPVIDRTGLTGHYDLDLDMDKIMTPLAESAGAAPTIASVFQATADALEDQLGLKLISTKAPIEFLVIDHAEKPNQQ